jgi:tetratricopeptide (TPR) repeat protein
VEGAIAALKLVCAAHPTSFPEAHYELGVLYSRRGMFDAALDQFSQAIAASRGIFPEAYYQKGRVHARRGEVTQAIEAFKTAIAQRQGVFAEAYNELGRMLYIKGDVEGATAAYSQAIRQRGVTPETVRSPEHDVALLLGGLFHQLAHRLRPAPRVKPPAPPPTLSRDRDEEEIAAQRAISQPASQVTAPSEFEGDYREKEP